MSATWSTYGRRQLMAQLLTPDVYVPPAGWWLALCLSAPRANDNGAMLVEPDPVATGYFRSSYPFGSANWLSTSPEEFTQASSMDFLPFNADSGLCQGWALCDTLATGTGNVWVVGSVVDPFVLKSGLVFNFNDAVLGLYD